MVDIYVRRIFALKPRYLVAAAMAVLFSDAVLMVSASAELGLFLDDGSELKVFLDACKAADVDTCEEFRFGFVSANEVDLDAVASFCKGALFPYRELVIRLATELIPEGAFLGNPQPTNQLKKRSLPSVVIGGRLVYRKLEDYARDSPASTVGSLGGSSVEKTRGVYQPSSASIKLRESALRARKKMEAKIASGAVEDTVGHLSAESTSLHQRATDLRTRAIDTGYAILKEVGVQSPRYREIFDEGGCVSVDSGLIEAFNDIILHGLEPSVVLTYGAEVYRFLEWMRAISLGFESLTDLRVAGYVRNCLGRGKTVPGRARNALIWFQRLADLPIGANSPELQRMVRSSTSPSGWSEPEQAPMIPPDVVMLLEQGCSSASTGTLRIFCGIACLLTFGIKRWSDAQRLQSIELASDAVVVRSWKSKKKKSSITWGAIRSGLSGKDWAVPFVKTLSEYGFPGEDYLITSPRVDMLGFTKTPARWADAERGMHAALIDVGVPLDKAISFTMHSFRHLFVTAGRQLQVPEPSIDVMVGWAAKSASGMASVYDSVKASSELLYKDFIHKNFQSGWTLKDVGSIPMSAKIPFGQVASAKAETRIPLLRSQRPHRMVQICSSRG